jgi:hypothetical protein
MLLGCIGGVIRCSRFLNQICTRGCFEIHNVAGIETRSNVCDVNSAVAVAEFMVDVAGIEARPFVCSKNMLLGRLLPLMGTLLDVHNYVATLKINLQQ